MERNKCNVCKAKIGGSDYKLRKDNSTVKRYTGEPFPPTNASMTSEVYTVATHPYTLTCHNNVTIVLLF